MIIGAVAFYENSGDRNFGSMIVIWGLSIAMAAIGFLLFVAFSLLGLRRLNSYASRQGFTAIAAMFGAMLGAAYALSHEIRSGALLSQSLMWIFLGALTAAIGALVWRYPSYKIANA